MSHSAREKIRGLYAIADTAVLAGRDIGQSVEQALLGGARIIQYRDKSTDQGRRRREAEVLARLCKRFSAILIINDDPQLAADVGAGVHLGRDDPDIAAARALLGNAIVGVSCYNRLERALEAAAAGADYVAFGRFHVSGTKPEAVQADADLLRAAHATLAIPIVAIGGITADNAGPLIEAGASAVAVIGDIFQADDIRAACERYRPLFKQDA